MTGVCPMSVMTLHNDEESRPVYDPERNAYRLHHRPDSNVSEVAIMAISDIEGVDPLDLDPVYDGYNLDVLDDLSGAFADEDAGIDGSITVSMAGYRVLLESDGTLLIRPTD